MDIAYSIVNRHEVEADRAKRYVQVFGGSLLIKELVLLRFVAGSLLVQHLKHKLTEDACEGLLVHGCAAVRFVVHTAVCGILARVQQARMTDTAALACLFFRVNLPRIAAAVIQLLLLLSGELPIISLLVLVSILNLLERRQAIRIGCVALQEAGFCLIRFSVFVQRLELG